MCHRYDMEHREELIKTFVLEKGIQQGIEIGYVQGRARVREKFIKSMSFEGISLEQIARIAQISVDEVKEYMNE